MKRILACLLALMLSIAPALAQFTSSGVIPVATFQIGAAGTQIVAPQTGLAGMTALSCQVRFAYGSGGTKTNIYLQTSLDQGQSWFDIANLAFATSGALEAINLSGLNSVTTPTALVSISLPDNTSFNGPLGDQIRAVAVSTGTYSGGTLAVVTCGAR